MATLWVMPLASIFFVRQKALLALLSLHPFWNTASLNRVAFLHEVLRSQRLFPIV